MTTFPTGIAVSFPHLAELLSVRVGQERFQGLEAGVDALHAPPLVAVCDLAADSPLLVLSRLRTEGDVGQAEIYKKKRQEMIISAIQVVKVWTVFRNYLEHLRK